MRAWLDSLRLATDAGKWTPYKTALRHSSGLTRERSRAKGFVVWRKAGMEYQVSATGRAALFEGQANQGAGK